MYKGKKVSLILPAYNEEESITSVILGFTRIGLVDEIVVVNNNSTDKTESLAKGTGKARVVAEKKRGYGYALRRGLSTAKGDILVMCDADNTYMPADLKKLLAYLGKYDFIFGTRVNPKYLLKGSTMGLVRRWANILVSTLISILFKGPILTDAGATFRVFERRKYEKIKRGFTTGGINFQPELTILALTNGFKVKEVPVRYGPRKGLSKISGSTLGGAKTAVAMVSLIIEHRFSVQPR